MSKDNYITIPIAAGRYGLSQYQIHALVINKKLKFRIANKQVMILEDSLSKFEKKYPVIIEMMRQRTTGDLAFVHFLGFVQNEEGLFIKA